MNISALCRAISSELPFRFLPLSPSWLPTKLSTNTIISFLFQDDNDRGWLPVTPTVASVLETVRDKRQYNS